MVDTVRDDPARSRFELDVDGVVAFVSYRRRADGAIELLHTETPAAARGRGIASKLLAGTLATIRARGLKVVPYCSFVRAYIAKHPETRDLLA